MLQGAASLSAVNIEGKRVNSSVFTKKTVTDKTKSPVTVGSAVKTIDASSHTKAVKITGNSLANTITGGNGKDTFIYAKGEGKDVIYGFANNDLLKITGTFNATYDKSKSEIYFKVGNTSNAITLKNFTATSFNVNGSSYKISGTKLIRN